MSHVPSSRVRRNRSGWARRLRVSGAALVVVAAVLVPSPAGANHSWGDYHWARTSNPFTLKLGDNVTATWDSYLVTSSADWSKSSVLDTKVVGGTANPKNCRATAGMVQVCNSKYGGNGWLGLASIWASGGHITQGTAKLNDTYFNTATYNTPAWRNMVMCQEVAHTFGLDHQDEAFDNPNLGSCMDYTNDPSTNQQPDQHDYDQLETIYAHLDATTTLAASTPSGGAASDGGHARAEWGRAVAQDGKGRDDHFVRDLGNGEQLVTFVIWAD